MALENERRQLRYNRGDGGGGEDSNGSETEDEQTAAADTTGPRVQTVVPPSTAGATGTFQS